MDRMHSGSRVRSRRTRRRAAPLTAVMLVVALGMGVALSGCSGDGDTKAARATTTTSPTTSVDIELGDVSADSAGAPVTISPDQTQRVLDALTTYVKGATVQPLRSGKPATADFGTIFDATTLASATTTDRGVLIDEGLPRVTGNLTATTQPVVLVGLGDQSGNLTLITAAMTLDVTGATKVKGGPLHIVRTANFTLQPDFAGTWRITAYDAVVAREGAGLTPTTTSVPTTTGVAK